MTLATIIGALFVSPFWGYFSSRLLLQSWLAFVNFWIYLIGFIRGKVKRKNNIIGIGSCIFDSILYNGLLWVGHFLLGSVLHFGYSFLENIIYWLFVAIGILSHLAEFISKIKNAWHFANNPGELEFSALRKKAGHET